MSSRCFPAGIERRTFARRWPAAVVLTFCAVFISCHSQDKLFKALLEKSPGLPHADSRTPKQQVKVKPKLVLLNEQGNHVASLQRKLPAHLKAISTSDVGTVVRIKESTEVVGEYRGTLNCDAKVSVWTLEFIDWNKRKVLFQKSFSGGRPPNTIHNISQATGPDPTDEALRFLNQMSFADPSLSVAMTVGAISCMSSDAATTAEAVRAGDQAIVVAIPENTAAGLTRNLNQWSDDLKRRLKPVKSQPKGFHAQLCDKINQLLKSTQQTAAADRSGGQWTLGFEKAKGMNYAILAYALMDLPEGPSLVVWKTPFTDGGAATLDDAAVIFRSHAQLPATAAPGPVVGLPGVGVPGIGDAGKLPAFLDPHAGPPVSLTVNVMCMKSQATPPTNRAMTSPEDALVCAMSARQALLLSQQINAWSVELKTSLNVKPGSPDGFHLELAKRINQYVRTTKGIGISPGRKDGRYQLTFRQNPRVNYVIVAFVYQLFEEGNAVLVWQKTYPPFTHTPHLNLQQNDVRTNSLEL